VKKWESDMLKKSVVEPLTDRGRERLSDAGEESPKKTDKENK